MTQPTARRVLLLVEHRRNGELLRDWLSAHESLDPVEDEAHVDVVVADAAAMLEHHERVVALQDGERPAYLPLLLVASPRDAAQLPRELSRLADEIVTTPVRRGELGLRIDRLLAVREQSVVTARRLEELGRSNVDLEQFAYVAAHELATPLAIVTGALETVVGRYRDRLDDHVKPLLDAAEQESERLQSLIQDLLAFSQAGRRGRRTRIDLQDIVGESLGLLQQQIDANGVDVHVGELPSVEADARQLRIVFTNLIGNAIKYRDGAGPPRVRVLCDDLGDDWQLSVEDNGRGVPAERMKTIFEMFERGEEGRQVGHGIGLALCRRIVERHDGRIWVEPSATGGSLFRFTLPKR